MVIEKGKKQNLYATHFFIIVIEPRLVSEPTN